jgi:hypothetical protein
MEVGMNQMLKMRFGAFLMSFIFFCSCDSIKPAPKDIIGKWHSADSALLEFRGDGSFVVKSFPAEYTLLPKKDFVNLRFDGSGKWSLRKESEYWEVYLDFKEVSDKKFNSEFPLLISGEKGVLANQPPWLLYVWKEEEGGERYEFYK